uniref:CUB domain-containing protein n=1 Tax=Strigamia maritima TaxID=126957 RepID=T1J660_STRMM
MVHAALGVVKDNKCSLYTLHCHIICSQLVSFQYCEISKANFFHPAQKAMKKLHSIAGFLFFLVCASVINAQDACLNVTKLPIQNFRSFKGILPDGCSNYTWVFHVRYDPDMLFAKFSSFDLTDMFDVVNIKTNHSEWVFTSTSMNTDDYIITNSSEIVINLFTNGKTRSEPLFTLDLFTQACGGTFTDKGNLTCNSTEKSGSKFYQLVVPKDQQVIGRLNNLDDAEDVEFYEGYNNKSAPLAVFTKNSPRHDVFSETNAMLVIVNSPKASSNFDATFRSDPNHTNFIGQEMSGIWELVDAAPLLNYTWLINPKGPDTDFVALTINEFDAKLNDILTISEGLAYKPILVLNESLTSQRSFYFPIKTGVRVDLLKAKVASTKEISVIITYSIAKDCSQLLESAPDSIASPGYPSQYFYNAKCQWSISNKNLQTYRLIVKDLNISSTDKLTYDYKTKTTAIDSQSGDIAFNEAVTVNWTSSINKALIQQSPRGFSLNFKTYDFGYPITVKPNASLKFSAVNKPYKCFWTVDAPRDGDEINNIQFTITTAKTITVLPLVIYDGGDSEAKILSVTFKDGKFVGTSRTNKLMLEILADKQVPAFEILFTENVCTKRQQCQTVKMCMHPEWKCDGLNSCGDWSDELYCHSSAMSCGGEQNRTLSDNSSTTVTLNDTIKFGEELNCVWKINTTAGRTLVALFGAQVLNNTLEMIVISDGKNLDTAVKIMELTSESPNTQDNIITASNTLWVTYFNFYGSEKSNFTLFITTQRAGSRVNGTKTHNITIPTQLKNETQLYEIIVNNNEQVETMFKPSKKTLPDWTLTFYDGFSVNALPLAVVKSESVNNPVVATTNKILVKAERFHDISSGVLDIKSLPTGANFVNQTDAGSLYLTAVEPQVYTWQIKPNSVKKGVEINGVINLKLSKLKLLSNDSLVVLCDDDRDGKAVALFSSSVNSAKVLHIPLKSGAFIKYNSTHKTSNDPDYAILSASYEVLPSCKQDIQLVNYDPQIVSSPGYPNIYPINAACNWNVTVPKGKLIHIVFNDFNLNEKHPLKVTSNTSTVLLAYNSTLPDDLLIVYESANIVWNSSRYDEKDNLGRGFLLSVRMLDCGGNITLEKGNFSTPKVNTSIHCGWAATVPQYTKDKDKKLNVVKFDVEPLTHPNMIIYNGGSSHSPILGNASKDELSLTNTLLFFYTYIPKNESKKNIHLSDSINVTFTANVCNRTCNASHLCMHDDWICNGVNDCGDNSDEVNCVHPPPTPPKPTPAPECPGCGAGWIVLSVIIGLIIGALLAIGIPILYRRFFGGA